MVAMTVLAVSDQYCVSITAAAASYGYLNGADAMNSRQRTTGSFKSDWRQLQ
jgi:hypothetical protein